MKIEKILTRREMNAISGGAGNEPLTPPPPPPDSFVIIKSI